MSSRESILEAIARNKPEMAPLPDIVVDSEGDVAALIRQFVDTLQSVGATVIRAESIQVVRADWERAKAGGEKIVNTIGAVGNMNEEIDHTTDALFLEPVDRAYISGTLGVAENGAVWLEESKMRNRLLPFICQHLVLVLDAGMIVPNMHEAYGRIAVDGQGYGVFVAGPSKTADIEQSLVIGAHGARSLEVFLVGV